MGVSFEGGGEVLFFFKRAPRMALHMLVLCLMCLLTEETATQIVIKIAFHVFQGLAHPSLPSSWGHSVYGPQWIEKPLI